MPYQATHWVSEPAFFGLELTRALGIALIAGGRGLLLDAFLRFALQGIGTPAPVLPTRHLVVSGPYRYLRNPMYIAVVAAILGQALWFGSVPLLLYAGLMWFVFHAFVLVYEEPTMRRTHSAEYAAYSAAVGRWVPRLTPWKAASR